MPPTLASGEQTNNDTSDGKTDAHVLVKRWVV